MLQVLYTAPNITQVGNRNTLLYTILYIYICAQDQYKIFQRSKIELYRLLLEETLDGPASSLPEKSIYIKSIENSLDKVLNTSLNTSCVREKSHTSRPLFSSLESRKKTITLQDITGHKLTIPVLGLKVSETMIFKH